MGGKGAQYAGGETLANFANSLLAEGQGARRETQRRANVALNTGRASGGSAIEQQRLLLQQQASGLTSQLEGNREGLSRTGAGRSSAGIGGLNAQQLAGFLKYGRSPTDLANKVGNQGVTASFGSIPTISSGFADSAAIALQKQQAAGQATASMVGGMGDIINQFAGLKMQEAPPPSVAAAQPATVPFPAADVYGTRFSTGSSSTGGSFLPSSSLRG
jgi:hypothetical protein